MHSVLQSWHVSVMTSKITVNLTVCSAVHCYINEAMQYCPSLEVTPLVTFKVLSQTASNAESGSMLCHYYDMRIGNACIYRSIPHKRIPLQTDETNTTMQQNIAQQHTMHIRWDTLIPISDDTPAPSTPDWVLISRIRIYRMKLPFSYGGNLQ